MIKAPALLLSVLLAQAPAYSGTPAASRVHISMYPCTHDAHGNSITWRGEPVVTLYDRQHYGDSAYSGFFPKVTVTKSEGAEAGFYFDVRPGNYEAIVRFSQSPLIFIHNGPLIVIPGYDRHLFVAGCSLTDWHSVAAVAGAMPVGDVTVSVLVFERKVHCGDQIDALDQKTLKPLAPYRRWPAVIDGGAYYANFHGYGKQDQTIALEFGGALFTRGTVLITATPDTPSEKPPLIIKDVTPELIKTAARAWGKLVCEQGF